MFNVTTKYDKIYDKELGKEVRKKVFMIRGDEAYARSTDIVLSYSTPVSGDVKGFKTTLTATVHRNIGSSKVVFYDGEEILGMADIGSGVHTVSLSDLYLSYVNEHEFYAEFKSNSQCLGSKSKKMKLTVPIPSTLETSITFNNPTTQINEGSTATVSATARVNNELVEDGTQILFYDNDTLVDTVETVSGVASTTVTPTGGGVHTIKASIEGSSSINPTTSSYNLNVGYNITFQQVPTIINGVSNTVKVSVRTWSDTAVANASVSMTDATAQTTDANGIASFVYTNAVTKDYTASYNNSSTTRRIYAYTPTSINITSESSIVGNGETLPISFTLNGNGNLISINGNVTGATLSPRNTLFFHNNDTEVRDYVGTGIGDVTLTASVGNVSKSYTIKDYLMYWTPTLKKNASFSTNIAVNGSYSETPTGMLLVGGGSSSMEFKTQTANCQMEFDVVETTMTSCQIGTDENMTTVTSFSANDSIKVVLESGTQKVYRNNALISTVSYTNPTTWKIQFPSSLSGYQWVRINNLKIKRL